MKPVINYQKTELDNGVRVVTARMPQCNSVALGVWVACGGRYENRKNRGISHFLEHLVFKGSRQYPGTEIKKSIEGVGGMLNGFTSEELTCFLVKILGKHLSLAMDILADMVLHPLLKAADIEKEKKVIFEEIKMYYDLPQHHVEELLKSLLWPNQMLGMSLLGTVDTVSSLKKRELSSYRKKNYTSRNLVIAAGGAANHNRVVEEVRSNYRLPGAARRNRFPAASKSQKRPRSTFFFKKTEQTHLCFGTHALPRGHPDRHALGILSVILGGNMSSRLFQRVREEKGLAYEISSHVVKYSDTGAFEVAAGVDNRKVNTAIALILKELKKMKKKPVSRDEFIRGKEFYTGQLLLSMEDSLNQMLWLGEQEIALNRIRTIAEVLDEVEKVTIGDLERVAGKIFTNRSLNLAVVGPVSERQQTTIRRSLTLE